MHVLFVHQNFPAQFGHIARHLVNQRDWTCTFVSETTPGEVAGIRKIQYKTRGGARESTHYCSRTFENSIWHSHAVFEACKAHPDIQPDLIVGRSGFGSTLFLLELYPDAPIVNYFEFFYQPHGVDMDFRREYPPAEIDFLRARARNAMLLLDLANCRSGYSPTQFQQSLFPAELRHKIAVIFDDIETEVYRTRAKIPRRIVNCEMRAGVGASSPPTGPSITSPQPASITDAIDVLLAGDELTGLTEPSPGDRSRW